MATNIRHAFFLLAGAAALLLTWPHAFEWMAAGGNILNPVQFFGDAINAESSASGTSIGAGGTAAFLSIDMAIAWLVFMVWVVFGPEPPSSHPPAERDGQLVGGPVNSRT